MFEDMHLVACGLEKAYRKGSVHIPVLKGVDLGVRHGELLSIVGASGSGKSTLLHLLGTLDAPDAGQIFLGGRRIDSLPLRERDRLRNEAIGYVFQFYHLLPELTALENVLLPLMIRGPLRTYWRLRHKARAAGTELLDRVGLSHRRNHKPTELSGGELQRAAIARALIGRPEILLADEPTGNLDADTGGEVLKLLVSLNRDENLTIIMVTHDPSVAEQADRVVRLTEGKTEELVEAAGA
jgi:lipoprotein-releasing system ATP-binding protein